MAQLKDILRWETVLGNEVSLKDGDGQQIIVRPQSQALTFRWRYGGRVWNRPVALLVKRGEQTERIPIVDVTRWTQLGLLGFSIIFSIFIFLQGVRSRRRHNE